MKDKTNIAQSVSDYITLHGEVYSGPFGSHSVDDSLGKTKQLLQFLMTFNNKLTTKLTDKLKDDDMSLLCSQPVSTAHTFG